MLKRRKKPPAEAPKPPAEILETPRCGAIRKIDGKACRGKAMANGRCRYHGGMSQGTPTKTKKPDWLLTCGLYSSEIHPAELDVYDSIKIGTLDEEIKLLKLQLMRAITAQRHWEEEMEKLNTFVESEEEVAMLPAELRQYLNVEVYERHSHKDKAGDVTGDDKKIIRKKRDYNLEIGRLCKLISELELTNATISRNQQAGIEVVDVIAEGLRSFAEKATKTLPGGERAQEKGP